MRSTDNPLHRRVLSDDQVTLALQYSTQWDSFAHVGAFFDVKGDGVSEKVYYNGYKANEHIVGPIDYQPEGDAPLRAPMVPGRWTFQISTARECRGAA